MRHNAFAIGLSVFFLTFLALNGIWHYLKYRSFTAYDSQVIGAYVLKQRCSTKGCYLTYLLDNGYKVRSKESPALRDLRGYHVLLWVKSDMVQFVQSFRTFFAPSAIVAVDSSQRLWRYSVADAMAAQHNNHALGELIAALYLGTPFQSRYYHQLSALGISHLSAISGFHVGIMATVLFALLYWPYRVMQAHYFPYRSRTFDITAMVLLILFGYVLFAGAIPSLLRAYAMMVIGFLFYYSGIKLLQFKTLALAVLILVALFPFLLFSIGFWLSVLGVFNIFLFLRYFKALSLWWQTPLLGIWLYVSMLPLSLYLFKNFSMAHPFSIIASLLFMPFYIVEIALHLLGYGGALDSYITYYFNMAHHAQPLNMSLEVVVGLSLLSVGALWHRWLFYLAFLAYMAVAIDAIYQVR